MKMEHGLKIPQYLFRGDSDSFDKRHLRSTVNNGLLLTNLCSGGNGREIFNSSLIQLLSQHIIIGWDKTHFLSFSSDESIAFFYGSNGNSYEETYDHAEQWDFIVLTLDTSIFISQSIKEISQGIYMARYSPTCKEFTKSFPILLIDTVLYAESIANKNSSNNIMIDKAKNDKEWLVFPAYPFGNNGEFAAKLDTNCISKKRYFVII